MGMSGRRSKITIGHRGRSGRPCRVPGGTGRAWRAGCDRGLPCRRPLALVRPADCARRVSAGDRGVARAAPARAGRAVRRRPRRPRHGADEPRSTGAQAAEQLQAERSVPPDPRGVMHELRAQDEPERDTLAAAQADAAAELFSAAAAERVSGRDAAARLIASSLLDDDPLVHGRRSRRSAASRQPESRRGSHPGRGRSRIRRDLGVEPRHPGE